MNNKKEIMKIVFALGEYYSKQLTESQIAMFSEDLSKISLSDLVAAINKYKSIPENVNFPLPAKIISMVNPTIDDKETAIDAVNLIISAVSRFGHNNKKAAKQFMGELAFETVERFGGWQHLCENLNQSNEGTFRAQLRELAVVVNKKSMLNELDEKPKLKTITNAGGEIFKLPEMKGF